MKPKTSYSEVCARSCSCSYKRIIPKEIFIKILHGDTILLEDWELHIIYFLNESPIDWICGVMMELNITTEDLSKINKKLPECFQCKRLGDIDKLFKYNS